VLAPAPAPELLHATLSQPIFDQGIPCFYGGADELFVPNVEKPELVDGPNNEKFLQLKVPLAMQLTCPLCDENFNAKEASKISIARHLSQDHRLEVTSRFLCRFCGETSDSKYPVRALNMHAKKMHGGFVVEKPPELPYKCDLCGDSFSSFRSLRSHVVAKHEKAKRLSLKTQLSLNGDAPKKQDGDAPKKQDFLDFFEKTGDLLPQIVKATDKTESVTSCPEIVSAVEPAGNDDAVFSPAQPKKPRQKRPRSKKPVS